VDRAYVLARGAIVADERAEVLRSDQRMLSAKYLGDEVDQHDRFELTTEADRGADREQ
jgi:hypothetical protein